jgi:hypothetical protein
MLELDTSTNLPDIVVGNDNHQPVWFSDHYVNFCNSKG